MPTLNLRPLSKHFGVEVLNVDLCEVTEEHLFPEVRAAFEEHSALLFRRQNVAPEHHIRLAELFGPLEDREADERGDGDGFEIPQVSNLLANGEVTGAMDLHTLQLKSNQLWHTDSTFLPVPALSNILMAGVVTESGGETELASTRAAWRDMPEILKAQLRNASLWHSYGHSRAKVSEELLKLRKINKWSDQLWRAVWTNPINNREALYIASHAYRIEGRDEEASTRLIEEAIAFCTQPAYVYSHKWRIGDVLIWDERATLHRGRPWPYDQPRALSSICSSATAADGLEAMRVRHR